MRNRIQYLLDMKMEAPLIKHSHDWKEEGNFVKCVTCGRQKLKMTAAGELISTGIKSNGIKYTKRNSRDRIFYPDEWKNFYDQLREQQKFTFHLLMQIGARIKEAQNIKVEDVDFINQRLILKITKHSSKSNKSSTRTMRISTQLCKMIKTRVKDLNLGRNDTLGLLSTPAANDAMKKALIKAGIKDPEAFSVHNIRKTSENWALSIGIDSMKLSKKYGHNLMTMYMHYTQSDAFSYKEKDFIKEFFGDTFIE